MKRWKIGVLVCAIVACACLALAGCQPQSYTPKAKEPTVSASALGQPGTLRVGVNSASAPLAGQTASSARIVGIDVDVAAYLADQLGCKVEIVDVGTEPEKALKNVRRVGLDKYWSYQIGDAKTVDVEFDGADVITTDMPDVENAFDNLIPHLRNGGRICVYVPNMNQLEKAVNGLRERGFTDIRSMEIIRRGMEVHPGGVRPSFEMLGHTGYLTFARKRSV